MTLIGSYWIQIDVALGKQSDRFWMQDCAGKDQVVRSIMQGGWTQYEPPLPSLIAQLCQRWSPQFIDIGANTGYYSLLAACTGATHVWAFEPIDTIRDQFKLNCDESGFARKTTISALALSSEKSVSKIYLPNDSHGLIETSASLNPDFRSEHSQVLQVDVSTLDVFFSEENLLELVGDVLIKIDVESHEHKVLMGADGVISKKRPFIALELLPGADRLYIGDFMRKNEYKIIHLKPQAQWQVTSQLAELSTVHRDHFLVPNESLSRFVQALEQL